MLNKNRERHESEFDSFNDKSCAKLIDEFDDSMDNKNKKLSLEEKVQYTKNKQMQLLPINRYLTKIFLPNY